MGRAIGATGAACATLLWGALLVAFLRLLMEPAGMRPLWVFIAMPFGVIAAMMFAVAVADLVVLVRRADRNMPWCVAAGHIVLAVLALWTKQPHLAIVPLVIAATQIIALRMFQMMPSQASSQR